MTINTGAPVVVGVDGSDSALDAVRVAAREAEQRRRPLRVVHAFSWPLTAAELGPTPLAGQAEGLRGEAEEFVAQALAEARKVTPDVPTSGVVVDGSATRVLLDEARDAALVVLGHRGLGGFAELLVGSVAVQVSARAQCPVLVVRGEPRADGPVVVGVDGSELSTEAVGFAFEEASRRGTSLVAVHAWLNPVAFLPGEVSAVTVDPSTFAEEEARVLAESVAGHGERYPDVSVRHELVHGSPAQALVEQSRGAQLVVVGAHGRGALGGLLLGSVSHSVLHHAHSPLAIVRHLRTADGS
ncbi:universal stress protein [Micromonospora sp. 15K316]|uniref:universal stress protein n=1 Tax=Micromonospora sp. 15K316 TaxID=2530376 RepID=UPI001051672E|nr:universal stress protein [Micromonospora sp. 15K316]TDC28793.1 universal stress protein [Micromonospora sp. 15K316]